MTRKSFTSIIIALATVISIFVLIRFMRLDSFAFAWALNFLLMILVFAYTEASKSPMISPYFDEKKWEKKGEIYELFGINLFRKLLVLIGWEKLNKKASPVEKSPAALMHLHSQTKKSELGHLIIFLIVSGFTVFVMTTMGILNALWLFVLNILLNLYPVLLQRYNRPRIERAIHLSQRQQRRSAT